MMFAYKRKHDQLIVTVQLIDIYHFTRTMSSIGPTNAQMAPSSVDIQQLNVHMKYL